MLESQPGPDGADLQRVQRRAEHPVDPLQGQFHDAGLRRIRKNFRHALRHPAARQTRDQVRRPVQGRAYPPGVRALLEPLGRLGPEPQPAGRDADARGVKTGGLQNDVNGILRYLGIGAAHYAGDGDGALCIGDDQHVRRQLPLLSVQRDNALAGARPARFDAPFGHLCRVEGVQRLAVFQHDEVGHIDHVVDRADARRHQAVLQPLGGRPDAHAPDVSGRVMRAQIRIGHGDGHRPRDVVPFLAEFRFRQAYGTPCQRRRFVGHAQHAEAVRPVGRQLQLQHRVVQFQQLHYVGSDFRTFRKHQDAFLLLLRKELDIEAELARGADHPLGFDAAKRRLFDADAAGEGGAGKRHGHLLAGRHVGSPAHDLQIGSLADIHRAKAQLIGVRVRFAGFHQPDLYAAHAPIAGSERSDLDSPARQSFCQILRGHAREIDIFV